LVREIKISPSGFHKAIRTCGTNPAHPIEFRAKNMTDNNTIFIGIDSGATTSKIGAVRADASIVSMDLLQRPTRSEAGPAGVIEAWMGAIVEFLADNNLSWDQVQGVGLAIPGPLRAYGVLDDSPNLPDSFNGWDVNADLGAALNAAMALATASSCSR